MFLSGCATQRYQPVFPGDTRTESDLAKYWPHNIKDYFASINIYTASIDGKWFNDKFGPALMLEPGEHEVIISFIELNLPYGGSNDVRFPGNYVIKFNAQKGKLYAPMFNLSLGEHNYLKEMCLAEVPSGADLSETRLPKHFIKCVEATIDPYLDKTTICMNMKDSAWPIVLQDRCTPEANSLYGVDYNPSSPLSSEN